MTRYEKSLRMTADYLALPRATRRRIEDFVSSIDILVLGWCQDCIVGHVCDCVSQIWCVIILTLFWGPFWSALLITASVSHPLWTVRSSLTFVVLTGWAERMLLWSVDRVVRYLHENTQTFPYWMSSTQTFCRTQYSPSYSSCRIWSLSLWVSSMKSTCVLKDNIDSRDLHRVYFWYPSN